MIAKVSRGGERMGLYRDEGVVLRTAKLGEADRIVTLFTKSHGKIRAVVKGVRRTKSRFGSRLEPFMRVDVLVAEGRSLDVISQAESIAAYGATIATHVSSYEAANVMVETVDKLVSAEHESDQAQYGLLVGAFNALAMGAHAPACISASYVMRALALAGWRPRFTSCVVCGKADDGFFSVSSGGVMCMRDHVSDAQCLSRDELRQLDALIRGDWAVVDTFPGLLPAVGQVVEDWAEYYLERPVRSMHISMEL